jgi:FrmR/RcnR family transcriptional regulator, repressor of frmRAB operon
VTHVVREKQKLLARVRRIRGQIEAIERAVEGGSECEQVLHLIAGVRGSVASLMAEVMEDHVRAHFAPAQTLPQDGAAVERFVEVVHAYLK